MLVLCLSVVIVLLDQLSKHVVRLSFLPGHLVPVVPGFFNLTNVQNTGAAWGIFRGANAWLAILSAGVLALILVFRHSLIDESRLSRVALGCMIGGIVGNLLDRVRLAYVVDFLDFHWGPHHFPSFNVADSAICIGVGLYVFAQLWPARRTRRAVPAGAPEQTPPAGG